jgi:putative hydrolase
VAVDTDAHAPGQLEWQRYGCVKAASAGVPVDRVMNALPMDAFLAWTAGHAA